MGLEIERRWLLTREPDDRFVVDSTRLIQTYLINEPGCVLRARVSEDDTIGWLTVKGERRADGAVPEHEVRVPAMGLFAMIESGQSLTKRRLDMGDGWVVDVFDGRHRGLVIAEREYESIEDAEAEQDIPPWMEGGVLEITGRPEFSNAHLVTGRWDVREGFIPA